MPDIVIDLRSDTVTRPTPEMRRAMFEAEVGDDVYREDPTVNQLEARAAEIFGKEAALFVPTGTMGNTIAVKCLTEHGQEVICDARGHLLNYELSMTAWFAGCQIRPVHTPDGILTWEAIQREVRPLGPHAANTGCIELENTHNMAGGTIYPQAVIDDICDRAHERGIGVHMDGARIFNAAAAADRGVKEICAKVDTVQFCLSKGLGAPAGSMIVGTRTAMDRARLYRKRLGGGMRQSGILAAAGLIALETMPSRLGEDHANARTLAGKLAEIPGIQVNSAGPVTNIVIFDVSGTGKESSTISAALKQRGVLINGISPTTMRAVTHYDVGTEQCLKAVSTLAEVVV
ncbi:low specificity L-threonine aldolase [uncultured Paludibaculum sp.]|uniref:threonine aldolase family protein n=1 Tax=uncultured Paludibaculum sp. TaxID=1765020 RepID=UPI002AAA8592|nr:low specificity L-threonine aldolase [uncultured Paludibaculum sp.]